MHSGRDRAPSVQTALNGTVHGVHVTLPYSAPEAIPMLDYLCSSSLRLDWQ